MGGRRRCFNPVWRRPGPGSVDAAVLLIAVKPGETPTLPHGRRDAEAALHLADGCEYAWGQRDALELLADAYRRLGDREQATSYQTRADDWNRRLQP